MLTTIMIHDIDKIEITTRYEKNKNKEKYKVMKIGMIDTDGILHEIILFGDMNMPELQVKEIAE